ncbi:GumC family protein [Desertivirga brevis]|uniref:GumC family protein n=1 Tax=Desertivirga brevis TaxID=2810310 RepID=UPI001A97D015|nr:polysaccharide biosynthesis tyrosine autokinase [Pedobacter sp. SYSU D00873]
MKTEKILLSPVSGRHDENDSWSLKDAVAKYVYHWPLFLLCLVLSITAAYLYLQYNQPKYTVKAKLLIKDEKENGNSQTALKDMLMPYQSGKNVEDEIEIIESRELMSQVVDKLQLWANYQVPGKLFDDEIYSTTPVKFNIVKPTGLLTKSTFEILIKDQNQFELVGDDGNSKTFSFNNTLRNNFGSWRLQKTPDFDDYIGKTIRITVEDPEIVTSRYLAAVSTFQMNKKASVVELSMKDKDVKRGKDILNNLITAYNNSAQDEKKQMSADELKFIDDRLASLKKELYSVEKDVEGFRSSKGLTDISSESKLYLESVKDNDANLSEVNVQLNIISGIERYLATNNPNGAPSTIGVSDPNLTSLINSLAELQLKRQQLLATTPEGNPVFATIDNQISSTKAAIRENVRTMKNSLASTRNQLQANNSRFMSSIKELPSDERQLVSIKRQQSIKENLYVYLLQKREEAALGSSSKLAFSKTVDEAYVDGTERPLAYTFALLAGLLVPTGLLFGRRLLNNRVTSVKDIEMLTNVPVSTELFYEESDSPIVIQPKSGYIVGEQFRSLRTDLQYLHNKKDRGRVTLITSSIASEGKSFVTSNLGVTLAASGRKTIILELDMRKPKISQNFSMDQQKGLSDFLQGRASKQEIIKPSEFHAGLSIIPTGSIPDNPSELLEQVELDELISWLRTEYDDILIDTPPIYLVTDALVLSRLTDAALYLVRQNYTYKVHLEFIEQLHKDNKMPKMKIVFNGVQMKGEHRYGYGYYVDGQKNSLKSVMKDMSRRLAISN